MTRPPVAGQPISAFLKSISGDSDESEMPDDAKKEQRNYARHTWRLACSFRVGSDEQRGIITNISARGFFVQTRFHVEIDADVIVTIEHELEHPIVVIGRVARLRKSHRSMSNIEHSGIGVLVQSAPEAFYQLVLELEN